MQPGPAGLQKRLTTGNLVLYFLLRMVAVSCGLLLVDVCFEGDGSFVLKLW